jgi:O-antigen/teichoic acid export membrane protein
MTNKNTFIKNFSKLFSGAFLSQLISFIISPVLSRLFTAEDFGVFALYIQILSPLLVLGGAGLYLLLPQNKNESSSNTIFQISMILSLILSFVIMLVGVFGAEPVMYFNILWPYLAIGILLTNIRGFFHFQSISDQFFLYNSKSKLVESLGGSSTNIATGYMGYTQLGLVFGNIVGQFLFIFSFLWKYKTKLNNLLKRQKVQVYNAFIREHKKHIVLQSTNQIIEFVFILSFSILITKSSSISNLGYFAFCYKIINTPLMLFADYFGSLALARVSDSVETKDQRTFILKSALLLFVPSVILIFIFRNFGVGIFSFVFGSDWSQAGAIARVYILGITSVFFIKSLQHIPTVKSKHEVYTFFSFLAFGLPVLVLLYGQQYDLDFISSLEKLSYMLFALACFYFMTLLRLFSNKD